MCRGWRDIFTSRPSLWTNLDTDVDKTRAFIQRSKSSPLDICARNIDDETYLDALSLVIPHVPRLRSLSFYSDAISDSLRNFSCHTPLLEDLEIHISSPDTHTLEIPLLNGDLPSLRNLSLSADTIRLPQKNTSNLRVFNLSCTRGGVTVTQILDFLESSPLLHKIGIVDSIPDSSDAPPERIVPYATQRLSASPRIQQMTSSSTFASPSVHHSEYGPPSEARHPRFSNTSVEHHPTPGTCPVSLQSISTLSPTLNVQS